jgi:hypothetical protein
MAVLKSSLELVDYLFNACRELEMLLMRSLYGEKHSPTNMLVILMCEPCAFSQLAVYLPLFFSHIRISNIGQSCLKDGCSIWTIFIGG